MERWKQYAHTTVLEDGYESVVTKVKEAMKAEGFGVLTEIDVKETLKKKIDADFRKYVILGACNPPYALKTLQIDLDVGLLLPCNIVVYENDDGKTVVSALNPAAAMEVIGNEDLQSIADEVSGMLKRIVASLT